MPTVNFLNYLFAWLEKAATCVGPCKQNDENRRGSTSYKTSKFDCLLLTLVMIRKGFDVNHMAFLFNILPNHVSRIFVTWVDFLFQCLRPVIIWPTQEVARFNLPIEFHHYGNTRCIIDYIELFIEKPFIGRTQKAAGSNFKHRNTAKVLIGIHPCGAFTFVSKMFVGSASDQEIVIKSGFLDLIEKGDNIMVNSEFNIGHLLLEKGATLNKPTFSQAKLFHSTKIASGRKHVERAIRRMKCFKLLRGTIPFKMQLYLNKILTIVAAISNFDRSLC